MSSTVLLKPSHTQHQVPDGVINAKYTTATQRSVTGDQNGDPWGFHLSNHCHIPFHLPHAYGSYMHNQYTTGYKRELQDRRKHKQIEGYVVTAGSSISTHKVQVT